MKVVAGQYRGGFEVVPNNHGEKRTDSNGRDYTYLPIPICRVPVGVGRTAEQAEELAERICTLLNQMEDGQSRG